MSLQILFLLVVFVAVSAASFFALREFVPHPAQERVEAIAGAASPAAHHKNAPAEALARWLAPLARPALPEGGWEKSPLRVRFYNAGLRSPSAPIAYFGLKTLLTLALPGLLLLSLWITKVDTRPTVLPWLLVLLAAIGYYLPNAALARLVAHRQRDLFEAFPDALDLMRVCVEAGLGIDACIERVGRDMELESHALAEEFQLVGLELRAGASRADALRNLALRVSLEDIDALVAMLVQADRFGTSVAEALRVHSDALRTRRRLLAEERAAKLPVKLLFPLVFCIFPALLAVLLGPAAIAIYRNFITRVGG
ncbi:MAG TPA: type II secretion system F family protein [Ramlibacter sp.]|uniref:type II secretion system F family protein n=1 Tax=Ramlibacter sp. TaxID=1917967 RepID=UPI002D803542|nr:type II secretion system F family protein [Ramlibacter sp.]HET8746403.1 type II secretion system F family protein [Ramlibacter sp.]